MEQLLLYQQEDRIVTLTLNQPERRNPLTGNTLVAELLAAIDRIHNDPFVRAVILTGAGPVFSTGGDIKTMERQSGPSIPVADIRQQYRAGIQRLPLALFNLEVPVIAAVNGPAMGAGLDLACMCDFRIASEQARFAESFVKLGLIPGDGGVWLLQRIVGLTRAAEMALTGDPIDAHTAAQWGLVSKVVPAAALMEEARRLADRIAANPAHAVRMTKRLLREAMHTRLDTLLEISAAFQALAHKTDEHRAAVRAFIDKRPPAAKGA